MANRAVLFDHWWNSCLEHQAFARIHRIGQSKVVQTAKLVSARSIDEEIMNMQKEKEAEISRATEKGGLRRRPTRREIVDLLCRDGQIDNFDEELLKRMEKMESSDDDSATESEDSDESDDGDESDGSSDNRNGDGDYVDADEDTDADS